MISRTYSPTEGGSGGRLKTEETCLNSSAHKSSHKKRKIPAGGNSEICEYKSNLRTPKSEFLSPMPPKKEIGDFSETARLLNNINLDGPGPMLGASPMIGRTGNNARAVERKSFLELSITEEMRNWERLFNIDHDISQKVFF